MADVPVLNAADADAAPKKSKKWLIIAIAAFVVLAGGGAAAFMLMGQNDAHGKKEAKTKEPLAPPLYVALDPPFVVNFEGEQLVRFLQITVQVMTRDPETVELLKANDPVVRNDLLLLFANQKYEVVAARAGKEKLRSDALAAIRHVVETGGGKPAHIEQVYFTSFVMQ
ncbi:MAG TPA: flagellar basal body-associated FliL family protein [Steroidobacteraceae bacterium]|nr:flagellar basal body-associated FliL family protein [Steroidobacteraceae bacterium]